MARDSDDDALRWEGDDDPTLAPGWKTVGSPVPLEGAPAEGDGAPAEGTAPESEAPTDAATQPGSAELVMLGVLGGVYLLYSIGWLITASRPAPVLADPVAEFMYGFGRWFAVSAPALWFGAVLWLAAGHRRARLLWLLAGAFVLVPVPFLLRG
ncbi:hypothetical protein [Agromyces bauzanensis]|uniref:DNA polymerase III subunit gamma/tau n=1 Tax=Agromyces bauzanensis TaxID=1308924 RepID=A0A917PA89_9MICO|nr:hypothetical protein [Agromyces bauzanensis]GGJ68441.1 hypothetical protein GCM10011372_02740 [Agromyces bauzanensis]